ncbi:MAG: DUF6671 family protein [Cyanobacteria bacterium J06554_6]
MTLPMTMWPEGNAIFSGRTAVIATMHRKERAIAPLLEAALGVTTQVPAHFNTDALGTFTREVQRPADQRETARLKAEAALDLTGGDLVIASEGSFGPHPQIPWVACDRELVLLYDRQHDLEMVGEVVSSKTNYRSQLIHDTEAALKFAETTGFPDHGLVVMPAADREAPQQTTAIKKGITTRAALIEAVTFTLERSADRTVHVETDMRALYNPTRMAVIAEATQAMVEAIRHRCPACNCPGFSRVRQLPGLPCSLCGSPTLLPRSTVYRCQRCQFEGAYPVAEATTSPANCLCCNP